MKPLTSDIWTLRAPGDWVVIPTNAGWNSQGANVMGAGLAKQAADRYPDLPRCYGVECRKFAGFCSSQGVLMAISPWLYPQGRLVLAVTKALNQNAPHLSWRKPSTLDDVCGTIESLHLLLSGLPMDDERTEAWKTGRLLVPALGCGAGGLNLSDVLPLLEALRDRHPDRVVLVLPDGHGSAG